MGAGCEMEKRGVAVHIPGKRRAEMCGVRVEGVSEVVQRLRPPRRLWGIRRGRGVGRAGGRLGGGNHPKSVAR